MVEAELQRRGWAGKPRVEGRSLVVGKGATQARADLEGTIRQWDSLPEDLIERRVQQMAQLLREGGQRVPVAAGLPAPRRARASSAFTSVRRALAPVVVAVATVCGLGVAFRYLSPKKQSPLAALHDLLAQSPIGSAIASATAPTYGASNVDHERAVIASAACSKSRARMARGGNVGPAEVEGWQVELVLLRRGPVADLSQSGALTQFVRRDVSSKTVKLSWPKASSLVAQERFDAQIEIRALPALGAKKVSGVSFSFSGPYVVPYFTEDQRGDYFLLADALADALGATDGGLFAHCADSESHHVGSWFLGATPGAAVGSLIYFMESYTDLPVLKPEVLGSGPEIARRGHLFDTIDQAASALSRNSVATLVGSELGMISGRPNHPARLTFPFRDGSRASRSGLSGARSLGLASAP